MDDKDTRLSAQFSAHCQKARETLEEHMARRALRPADGWSIHEFTRQVAGHTEIVMRPMHKLLAPPHDLECVCIIDEFASEMSSECREEASEPVDERVAQPKHGSRHH